MEEKELVERILQRGDTKYFDEIVKRYSGPVFSKALRVLKREDLAKDITQQAFIRAYTNLDSWRGGSLGAWITAIAMYLSLNTLDKLRRHRMESIEDTSFKDSPQEYSDEHEQLIQAMDEAIESLPSNDRAIIRLHYYEGKKQKQ
jgi:RNA polymerase sigma-70 factor (ECF subfamily)